MQALKPSCPKTWRLGRRANYSMSRHANDLTENRHLTDDTTHTKGQSHGEPYVYNFDMVVLGEAGSAGFSVDPATTSSACVL